MIIKRIILIAILASLLTAGFTQKDKPQNDPTYDYKWLHFGFTVGLNTMDFGIKRPENPFVFADVSRITPGFQVSIVSDLRLGEYASLRFLPGITFGQRTLYFYKDSIFDREMELESNFLDFPLLLKYKAERVNNYRPYVVCGINARYDMAARKEYEEDTEVYVRLRPFDFYIEVGFGIDFYLQYFKFSTELKLAVGFRNVLVDDPATGFPQYVNSIDRLNSYLLLLCFHFE